MKYRVGILLLGLSAGIGAEILPDPTRPPDSILHPKAGGPKAEAAPVLQSVFISPSHKSATINGEVVLLGGNYRGAKLISINETEVRLKSGDVVQVLKLTPSVGKTTATQMIPNATSPNPTLSGKGKP